VSTSPRRGRRTVARHGALRSPSAGGQLMRLIGVMMAVVLVAAAGVATFVVTDLVQTATADAVDINNGEAPPDVDQLDDTAINVLIAGLDECDPSWEWAGERCTDPEAAGARNDVTLVMHISPEPRRVTVISFPRDLMVPIPSCTDENGNETGAMSKAQINSSFYYGGLDCTVRTIADLSGLDIQYAASVNWQGVVNITNAIGGVEVCVANGIYDRHTGLDLQPGTHTLSGVPALQFLRTRYGVGGSDLSRISNQQQYMAKLARKLVSDEVLTNWVTLLRLAKVGLENVDPSTSLTDPATIAKVAMAVKNVPFDEINFLQYPVWDDPYDANRVVPNYEDADQLWAALESNQPLFLTGDAGSGVVGGDGATPEPTEPEGGEVVDGGEAEGGEPTPTETPVAPEGSFQLPSTITGSSAAADTCSNGNVRQ